MNIDIRQATAEDVEAMLDALEPVVEEAKWLGVEPPLDRGERRNRLLASFDSPRSVQLLAMVEGRIVGHLGLEVATYGVAQLGMFVSAGWRARGVGSALVHAAVGTARLMGAHKLSLQVWPHNRAARRLYLRHGFAEEGRLRRHYRRRNGQLWDAVIMGLVLDEQSEGSPYPDD